MGCQAAAPSAAGSTSCFAARSAPSCSVAASGSATAAADPWQNNSLLRCSTLARAQTRDCNIGTLANQQLSLLGRTCLTRPSQDIVAASLSILRTLICSLDKDLWQTGATHPDCPCPPIAVLQPLLHGLIYLMDSNVPKFENPKSAKLLHPTVDMCLKGLTFLQRHCLNSCR